MTAPESAQDDEGAGAELVPAPVADLDRTDKAGARARRIAESYRLYELEGNKLEDVANVLGVSIATAWRDVQEAKAQIALLPWLDKEDARTAARMRLRAMRAWAYSDASATGGKALEYIPLLLKIEEREARLMGLDAPSRIDLNGPGGPRPDPKIIAEIQATLEQQEGKP